MKYQWEIIAHIISKYNPALLLDTFISVHHSLCTYKCSVMQLQQNKYENMDLIHMSQSGLTITDSLSHGSIHRDFFQNTQESIGQEKVQFAPTESVILK